MKFDETAILLSCHTFEDFPVFHKGKDADSLLANWTALWHPHLIANCRRLPTWYRVDDPPTHDLARLLVQPTSEGPANLDTMAAEVAAAGGLLIQQQTSRDAILQTALANGPGAQPVDPELAADFMALGFAYLQIELLTRQMRYATRVSETAFADNVVQAAEAAVGGDVAGSRTLLQSCFDLLSQERNHYYAVDVYLIDLSLVAESLIGSPLQRQLVGPTKSNLLLEACLLERIQRDAPSSWESLQQAVADNRVGLIGGEFAELPLALLSTETIRRQLDSGITEFNHRLGRRPQIYGRRRFGLVPALPQMLLRLDFAGAVHATFDGGRFPEATQAKSRWEGDGQFSIDAITRAPLDATETSTFLSLATSLSESMDMDHIATRVFAHWAGDHSPWYDELRRVSQFTNSLGRFVTVDEYFGDTYDPGIHDHFRADQYRSPWLQQQAAAQNTRPISACVDYWRVFLQLQSWLNCSTLWLLVQDVPAARNHVQRANDQLDQFSRAPFDPRWRDESADIAAQLQAAAEGLVGAVYGQRSGEASAHQQQGTTLVNPWSFPRRSGQLQCPVLPAAEPPVYAVEAADEGHRVIADVPAMGLTQITSAAANSPTPHAATKRKTPPLADDHVLRNEFLEAHLDPRTGSLITIRDYRDRANRLSQQLACRTPPDAASGRSAQASYSQMIGDSLEVLRADSICGQIQTRGRLVDDDQRTLATFQQTFELWRGSRVVQIHVAVQTDLPPREDPWDGYIACRFAWSNEAAELSRALNDVRTTTSAKRFEAPLFVQIDDGSSTTTVLTGGLPFHRRIGRRMLDTLLVAGHEQQRQFRLGVGLDLKQPFREALGLLAPELNVPWATTGSGPSSMWLFHVDARHVLCPTWYPVWDQDRVTGLRIRMFELDGRRGRVTVQSFRSLKSARKIDGLGQTVEVCEVDGPRMVVNVSPHEQIEVEALFA